MLIYQTLNKIVNNVRWEDNIKSESEENEDKYLRVILSGLG
jgi:hypothetical protein